MSLTEDPCELLLDDAGCWVGGACCDSGFFSVDTLEPRLAIDELGGSLLVDTMGPLAASGPGFF